MLTIFIICVWVDELVLSKYLCILFHIQPSVSFDSNMLKSIVVFFIIYRMNEMGKKKRRKTWKELRNHSVKKKSVRVIECINKHCWFRLTSTFGSHTLTTTTTGYYMQRPPLSFFLSLATVSFRMHTPHACRNRDRRQHKDEVSSSSSTITFTITNEWINVFFVVVVAATTRGALWCQSHSRKNSHTRNSFGEINSQTIHSATATVACNMRPKKFSETTNSMKKIIISMRCLNQFSFQRSLLIRYSCHCLCSMHLVLQQQRSVARLREMDRERETRNERKPKII